MNEAGTRERLTGSKPWGREVLCLRAIARGNVLCLTFLTLLASCTAAQADSIVVDGKKVENVYVQGDGDFYSLRDPADGSVQNIPKSRVARESFVQSADRDSLYEKWQYRYRISQRVKEMERTAEEERARKEREERGRIQEEEARSAQEREDAERVAHEQRIQAEEAERARIEKERQQAAKTEQVRETQRQEEFRVLTILGIVASVVVVLALVVVFIQRADTAFQAEQAAKLKRAVEELDANPSDHATQLRFLRTVKTLNRFGAVLETCVGIVKDNPTDIELQDALMSCAVTYFEDAKGSPIRDHAYKSILEILAVNSEPAAKQFLLTYARWHYAFGRADRKLTIYDEQAIQNDILVHCKS